MSGRDELDFSGERARRQARRSLTRLGLALLLVLMVLGCLAIALKWRGLPGTPVPASNSSTPPVQAPLLPPIVPAITAGPRTGPAPEWMDKLVHDKMASEHWQNSLWPGDEYDTGNQERGGYEGGEWGFSIDLETKPGYSHQVIMEGPDKWFHIYHFPCACGHRAMTSPDLARDYVFLEPEKLAAEYAKEPCEACQRMARPGKQVEESGNGAR